MLKLEPIKLDLIIKNKNKVLNLGIMLLLLYAAFQVYSYANKQERRLIGERENEIKKNKVIENITSLEKVMEGYKKALIKQDLGSIMNTMSNIAKSSSIEIISIKPLAEESNPDYSRFSFAITARASNYHSLADFISRVENYKDIYFVDEVLIASSESASSGESGTVDLKVSLRISTISYL